MSEFHDRLVALDPVARQNYEHRDLESLISRVVAQPVAVKRRFWHHWPLTLASALIAGSLATATTLALVEGAPAVLPALALKSVSPSHSTTGLALSAAGPMRLNAEVNFSAGPALSAAVPTSASYQLLLPPSPSAEASRIAAVFGVTGVPVQSSANTREWTVRDASGASLVYDDTGVPEWSFDAGPALSSSSSPLSQLPGEATLVRDAQGYLAKLGYDYAINLPTFGTSTTSSATSQVSNSTGDVAFTIDVGGLATDQSVSFSLNANNALESAYGPTFRVGKANDYPLQSPAEGVSALNAAQASEFASTKGSSAPPKTAKVIEKVSLNSSTLQLATYQLIDGATWLLPVYRYEGTGVSASGPSSSSLWFEIAVDPTYVEVATSPTTGSPPVVNY